MWRPGQLVDPVRIPYYASVRVQALHYDTNLPSTSVVIIFTNEAWSPLIRTIYSVLNRSPPQATLIHHHAVQFLLQHFRKMHFIHVISCGTRQRCPWVRNGMLYLCELCPVLRIRIRGPVLFWHLDPRWKIRIRGKHLGSYFRELIMNFLVKYTVVRHVTGNDQDYLRKIPRVVVQISALL
jgi:hypothetical protein